MSSAPPPSPFMDNLSKASGAMGSGKDSSDKKEDKDPTMEFVEQLVDFVMGMSGAADTDMSPMTMLNKGMDFLNQFDEKDNGASSPDPGKDAENTEELETIAKLAL